MVCAGLLLAAGCKGDGTSPADGGSTGDGADDVAATDDDSGGDTTGGPDAPPSLDGVGPSGMRRLTRYEFDNVVRDILGDDSRPSQALLPEEERAPFDNEYDRQQVTQPLVAGIEILSRTVAQDLVADPTRRADVVGCTPSGPADADCMRSFVTDFGRLALRRPLAAAEVDEFADLGLGYAQSEADFFAGVEVVVRAMLQDAEFIYRIEVGTELDDDPGVFALSRYEVATRLSFFLWGSTPDADLLAAAEAGTLDDAAGVRATAAAMLTDARARSHVDRFHALWLGYTELPHPPALTNAMRTETAALVQRVVFDDASSWLNLFTSTETYLDATLAEHYGLPAPAGDAGWVDYGDSGRMGLLSHGSFLSVASSATDTSPTKRGALIRAQVMCMPIPPPPPDVMADNPPEGEVGDCKIDRYAVHAQGSCAGCHDQMDLVGFGLENYDRQGRFRDHDDDRPDCPVSGEGEVVGIGEFVGPAQLAQLLVDSTVLETCVSEQLFRYAMGRPVAEVDEPYLAVVGQGFADADFRFDALMIEMAGNDAFRFRLREQE
jgi:hypothetical protein